MRHYTLIISFREKESERREKQFNRGHSGPFKKRENFLFILISSWQIVTRRIDIFFSFLRVIKFFLLSRLVSEMMSHSEKMTGDRPSVSP